MAAGAAYGLWGTLSTLYGFALGPAIDRLGVRRALVISFSLSAASKLVLALCRTKRVALLMLYGPLPAAAALGIPVMTIAVRRATHEANRGAAYGLFYSLMNVAALAAGALTFSVTFSVRCRVLTFRLGCAYIHRAVRGCVPLGPPRRPPPAGPRPARRRQQRHAVRGCGCA